MALFLSVAVSHSSKRLAIQSMVGNEPISRVFTREQVSRKFPYHQKKPGASALDQAFAPASEAPDALFYLPWTGPWMN